METKKQYVGHSYGGTKIVTLESTGETRWAKKSSHHDAAEYYLNDYGEVALAGHNYHGSSGYGEILKVVNEEDIDAYHERVYKN